MVNNYFIFHIHLEVAYFVFMFIVKGPQATFFVTFLNHFCFDFYAHVYGPKTLKLHLCCFNIIHSKVFPFHHGKGRPFLFNRMNMVILLSHIVHNSPWKIVIYHFKNSSKGHIICSHIVVKPKKVDCKPTQTHDLWFVRKISFWTHYNLNMMCFLAKFVWLLNLSH
jgi:hypothetical protein